MANFWASDPRAGDASDREATRGTNILYPPPDCTWPADFSEPVGRVEIGGAGVNAPAVPLTDVVTRLDGREAVLAFKRTMHAFPPPCAPPEDDSQPPPEAQAQAEATRTGRGADN